MKNVFQFVLVTFIIVSSLTLRAQTKSPKLENSLLWEVTGNNLSKPSYLYGTISICPKDYFLAEKTKKAFEASNKLVLDINISDPNEVEYVQQKIKGKGLLSKTLKTEEASRLNSILKKKMGIDIQQVDEYSLFTVMFLVNLKYLGCLEPMEYSTVFIEMAKKKNIPVIGLGTAKETFFFSEKYYSDSDMISEIAEMNEERTAKQISNYKKENIYFFNELSRERNIFNREALKIAYEDKNVNLVKTMSKLMQNENVFFAVFLDDLVGDLGYISLLRNAGYTVRPVMN